MGLKIAVIGGDKRMLFAAKELLNDGHKVCIAGFDSLLSLCDIRITDIITAVSWADMIILPVMPVKGGYLNAPYTSDKIRIGDLLCLTGEKPVFSGSAQLLLPYKHHALYDYAAREDFTYRNAELTAEGALSLILSDYEGSVCGSRILVTGYGRIAKLLSEMLRCMGAEVTVAARKDADRALIGLRGMTATGFGEIDYSVYDIIFNTVPAPIIGAEEIDRMREDVFVVDLASLPGGVDFNRTGERGLSCIHALSLPGSTAPLAAGRIIKDTIITILSELNGAGSV